MSSHIYEHPWLLGVSGIIALILLIGLSILIALSEISFAAAREPHIRLLAENGNKRAMAFLQLRRNSGQILTVLQICLNAVGVLGGIISDAMLGPPLGRVFIFCGLPTLVSKQLGGLTAFIFVTSAFVLFADLIPKRIAMNMPDRVALAVGWFPRLALKCLYPPVMVFSRLSDWLLALLHIPATSVERVTPEDLRAILNAGMESGALSGPEHQLIQNVLALQSRTVGSAMTPRDEIIFLDAQEPLETQRAKVQAHPYSRYPLCKGGLDNVIGSIRAEDVLAAVVDAPALLSPASQPRDKNPIFRMRRDVLSLPDTLNLWEMLAQFDKHGAGFAIIVNEYGLVVGLITYKDIMGALMDGLANPFEEQAIVQRDANSWLIDGAAPVGDVIRELHVPIPPALADHFETIGGFVLHRLQRTARKADRVETGGFRFEVVDVDGFRINQLLVTRMHPQ